MSLLHLYRVIFVILIENLSLSLSALLPPPSSRGPFGIVTNLDGTASECTHAYRAQPNGREITRYFEKRQAGIVSRSAAAAARKTFGSQPAVAFEEKDRTCERENKAAYMRECMLWVVHIGVGVCVCVCVV